MKKNYSQISYRVDENLYSLLASEAAQKGVPANALARQMLADNLLSDQESEELQMLREIRALAAGVWAVLEAEFENRDELIQVLSSIKQVEKRVPQLIHLFENEVKK